jgi:glutamate synthase (NADPH/NADH) large chain
MIGAVRLARQGKRHRTLEGRGLDFSKIFYKPKVSKDVPIHHCEQDHNLGSILDRKLIEKAACLPSRTRSR